MARKPIRPASQALSRLAGGKMPSRVSPYKEIGVSGTAVHYGYIQNRERAPDWVGRQRYLTSSEIATNVSIVAASIHYFLNLIAHPKWSFRAKDEKDKEAVELAEFAHKVFHGMYTPWNRIVRQAGIYRFHGFNIQEWIADKRKDGRIGFRDLEVRPQHTIERWEVDDSGTLLGVWQRPPDSGQVIPLPRSKFVYMVEDTLTDSPEGLGLFRHMGEPYSRLKQYLALEARGFERDLRGTPIGRVPYTQIREAVANKKMTQAQADSLIEGMRNFVEMQVKSADTGMLLDSQPYESQNASGVSIAGALMWDMSLLSGGVAGLGELGAAIDRLQRELARIVGTEHLMMGDQGGNRALAVDKSRNLYLIANSVLSNIAASYEHDLLPRLWELNGFDEDKMPEVHHEDVAFRDVEEVTSALSKMATAGAILNPDDPVINDVRDLLGVSQALPPTPEQLGALGIGGEPADDGGGGEEDWMSEEDWTDEDLEKGIRDRRRASHTSRDRFAWEGGHLRPFLAKYDPNQPRHPAGNPQGGQWARDYRRITEPFQPLKIADSERILIGLAHDSGLTWDGMSDEEREALRFYTGSGYNDVNNYLRWDDHEEEAHPQVERTMHHLDEMFSRSRLSEDLIVYRGVKQGATVDKLFQVGNILQDSGYVSTSIEGAVARSFARAGGWVVEIAVPKGSHAVVPTFRRGALAHLYASMEGEIILPRNSKFRVVSVTPNEDYKVKVVRLEVVDGDRLQKAFNPNQPRHPKGHPDGGQWVRAYHGSNNTFDEFRVRGSGTVSTTFGPLEVERHGAYFSDSPEFAASFGANVTEHSLAIENTANLDDEELRYEFVKSLDAFKERELWLSAKHAKHSWQLLDGAVGARFVEFLQAQGYDSATFVEETMTDSGPVEGRTYVVFDSTKVRKYNPNQPRHPKGHPQGGQWVDARWVDANGGESGDVPRDAYFADTGKFNQDKENKVVRDQGLWGSSHGWSRAISGRAAFLMGIDGYDHDPELKRDTHARAEKFLSAISDSPGSKEPLYHGFENVARIEWKAGDTFKIPLIATSGGLDSSASYGIRNYESRDTQGPPTVFEFPKGTRIAGYSKWADRDAKTFGHLWGEALTAGEFRIVSTRTVTGYAHWKPVITVVRVEPISYFNPKTKQWEAA